MNRYKYSPNTLVYIMLAVWWVVNLLQATFTELANDEAYYFMFSQDLAWGYFDHPPMTALLVRMGAFLGGELGVRFFFTLLQPLYLAMLWHIIRPAQPSRDDSRLFVVIAAAIPMLQLYGFIAVPDAPLLFCSALFLLFYKRFTDRDTAINALLLGVSVAALAYSKYHGALVVIFTLASNPRILKNPRLYLAAAVAAVLIVPHLIWQYENDWASFRYHLMGRNKSFKIGYVTEYILNIFAVFNPLFFPTYIKGWIKSRSASLSERAMYFIALGMIGFFLLSSIRGYVQPQWVIPASFGFIAILFSYARLHGRTRRYTMVAGCVTIALIALVRIVMIFNPIGLRFEIFNNRPSYAALADAAAGRTIVFGGSYAIAAKYNFYTGGKAYSQPSIYYRTSQWQFKEDDTNATGEQVLVEVGSDVADMIVKLANGKTFGFKTIENFHPVRKIEIDHQPLPEVVATGDQLQITITITNPYDYAVELSPDSIQVAMVWGVREQPFSEYVTDVRCTLPAHGSETFQLTFTVPETLESGDYRVGYIIKSPFVGYWFADRQTKVKVK